jgi:hypothetical protein
MSWKTKVSLATEFRLTVSEKRVLCSLEELLPIKESQTFIDWIKDAESEGLLEKNEAVIYIAKGS